MQLKLILCASFFALCVFGLKAQATIYVAPNASGNGNSWQNASSVQDAVSNASDNDTIKLMEGIYNVTATLEVGKILNIYGGYSGTGNTRNPELYKSILDGGSLVSLMYLKINSSESIIDGVNFENGFGSNSAGALKIEGSKVLVRNCVFKNNVSKSSIGSGAIYVHADNVVIDQTRFVGNQFLQTVDNNAGGGAIHIRFNMNTLVTNCEFTNNTSYYPGGAIHSWAPNTSIKNSSFVNNHSGSKGGAIYKAFDDLNVEKCIFTGNSANEDGGAIYNNNDPLYVSNSIFKNNSAMGNGGGVFFRFHKASLSKVHFENNQATLHGGAIYLNLAIAKIVDAVLWNNNADEGGGAVYNGGEMSMSNIDFIANNNTAYLIVPNSSNKIYNSIFYNNTPIQSQPNANPDIEVEYTGSPVNLILEITQNILQQTPTQGTSQSNLIAQDPLFIDAASGDFKLQHSSPAIDAGKTMLYNSVSDVNAGASVDLAGDNRLTAANIDLGAYEYSSVLNCTQLSSPLNNAADVAVDTDIQWNAVATAIGYRISIGTSSGGADIVNNLDLGNVTSFMSTTDLPEDTTIYVMVIPYNEAGDAVGCSEEYFTTEKLIEVPNCTQLRVPLNSATDVALNTTIQWDKVLTATGYRISIGTRSGGADIVNNLDLANTISYTPTADLPEDTTIYVRVIPYNEAGDAVGCTEEHFTTEKLIEVPDCAQLRVPLNNATGVALNTTIQWDTVVTATGYRISIGTTSGGAEIVNNLDLGNTTSYKPTTDLPEDTTIYVMVIPYNEAGDAVGCSEEYFSTESSIEVPACTQLKIPLNSATGVALNTTIQWDTVLTATGYRISIGSTSGGADIVNNLDLANTTSYTPTADLPEDATIYVRVIPYNAAGDAVGCSEGYFTTEKLIEVPDCTQLRVPLNSATGVAINTTIQWDTVVTATGYRISIGTSSGGADVVNKLDLGNITSYTPTTDLPEGTTIYVRVIPYNEAGDAVGCSEEYFTTEKLIEVPDCTQLMIPLNSATGIALNITIQWDTVLTATGYRISIGSTSGGADIVNNLDLGNVTSFMPTTDLPEDTTIYVRVIPYNEAGDAVGCSEEYFTTEIISVDNMTGATKYGISPNGDLINDFWEIQGIENFPNNEVTVFNRWGDMVFQVSGYDNQTVSFRGTANKNTALGGGVLPEGTYFFKIVINSPDKPSTTKGFIVLKR